MTHWVNCVAEFQRQVLGNTFPLYPQTPSEDHKQQTIDCLIEEVTEFRDAQTVADHADALVDLIYFSIGALYQMGVDTDRVFNAVHTKNMQKVHGQTKRGHENDAAKPEDWEAPDHSWLDEEKK